MTGKDEGGDRHCGKSHPTQARGLAKLAPAKRGQGLKVRPTPQDDALHALAQALPPQLLAQQIDAVAEDIGVDAVKIGMLATGEIVAVVADRLARFNARNVVLDPVLVATSGDSLGAPDVVDALLEKLLPLAALVTPNLPEIARLLGRDVSAAPEDMQRAGEAEIIHGRSSPDHTSGRAR